MALQQHTLQNNDVTVTLPTETTHVAHVLNTIDEEETAEDDKPREPVTAVVGKEDGSDSECEVTVTIKLPLKKVNGANKTEKEMNAKFDSPVDFWQQINDGAAGLAAEDHQEASNTCTLSSTASGSESSEDATTLQPPSDSAYRLNAAVSECELWHSKSEDADSGITTSSTDFNGTLQTSEMDVNNRDGGSNAKKYQRTCTHSRLFTFLQDDDKQSLQSTVATEMPVQSSCTSGYSSAATTPITPSAVRGKYESDSNRTEYDNYYKSWEYACPYFGYDILPSKAFKTILHGSCSSIANNAAVKFKCPKISIEKNGS